MRIKGDRLVEYYNPYKHHQRTLVYNKEKNYFYQEYFSDGCYLVKLKKLLTTRIKKLEKEYIKDFIEGVQKEKLFPAKVIGEFTRGIEDQGIKDNSEIIYIHVYANKRDRFYDSKYIDCIFTLYPKANIFITHTDLLIFKITDEIVGIVNKRDVKVEDIFTDFHRLRIKEIKEGGE